MRDETARILVVDDEPAVLDFLTRTLRLSARHVKACYNADSALEYARKEKPDLLVADYRLPDMDGVSLSRVLKDADPELEVILITGEEPNWNASGIPSSWDWVAKPFQGPRLRWVAEHALERHRLRRENRWLSAELNWVPPAVFTGAHSPSILSAMKDARAFAQSREPLLWISGEPGVGKRSLARAIHEYSPRASLPIFLVPAIEAKVERFEQMGEGTLVITQSESLSRTFCTALLSLLEDRALGKNLNDLKVILLSEMPMDDWNSWQGSMIDLQHSMQTNHIDLPALRHRGEDLFPLIAFYLKEWAREHLSPVPKIELVALRLLEHHPWPRNVTELQEVLYESLVLNPKEITGNSLKSVLKNNSSSFLDLSADIPHRLEDVERQVLGQTLHANHGDKAKTAKELGISVRTLYRKLRWIQPPFYSADSGEDLGGIRVDGESGEISG